LRGISVVTGQFSTRLSLFLVVSFVLVAAPTFSQGECRWNEGHFPQGPVGDYTLRFLGANTGQDSWDIRVYDVVEFEDGPSVEPESAE